MMALLPFASRASCQELAKQLNSDAEVTSGSFFELREVDGVEFSADRFTEAKAAVMRELRPAAELELLLSGELYVELRGLPTEVREDYDFWRGFTLAFLYDVAVQRALEGKAPRNGERKWEIIGAGSNTREILAWRMFSRGQVCATENGDGTFSFPNLVEIGTTSHDFWLSHVLGTHTGTEHSFAKAFVKLQVENRLSTDPLRAFVRDSVNRPKRTIATHLMSLEEAEGHLANQLILGGWAPSSDNDELQEQ